MKKVIRLTESDLVRIVKRVIKEGSNPKVLNNLIHHANQRHPQYNPKGLTITQIIQQNGGIDAVLETLASSGVDNNQRYDIAGVISDKFNGNVPGNIRAKLEQFREKTTGEKFMGGVKQIFKGPNEDPDGESFKLPGLTDRGGGWGS
jgi:hypothetical protein